MKNPTNRNKKNAYKEIQNKVSREVKKAKNKETINKLHTVKNDIKKTWAMMDEITGKTTKKEMDEKKKKYMGGLTSREIAENFAKSFSDQVENIIDKCNRKIINSIPYGINV